MTATTNCPHCGQPMPLPTGRQARRRYCSDRCRKDAWIHRQQPTARPDDEVSDVVSNVDADSVHVATTSHNVATMPYDAVATPGGQHRCPHCRQPLAVISVIVPAAAAHIPTPEVMHMSPT